MSTQEETLTPYVELDGKRFCKYCGKTIGNHDAYCSCPDSKRLKEICHKLIGLELQRGNLVKSAPKPKFTTALRLVPTTEPNTVHETEDEPVMNF